MHIVQWLYCSAETVQRDYIALWIMDDLDNRRKQIHSGRGGKIYMQLTIVNNYPNKNGIRL